MENVIKSSSNRRSNSIEDKIIESVIAKFTNDLSKSDKTKIILDKEKKGIENTVWRVLKSSILIRVKC